MSSEEVIKKPLLYVDVTLTGDERRLVINHGDDYAKVV